MFIFHDNTDACWCLNAEDAHARGGMDSIWWHYRICFWWGSRGWAQERAWMWHRELGESYLTAAQNLSETRCTLMMNWWNCFLVYFAFPFHLHLAVGRKKSKDGKMTKQQYTQRKVAKSEHVKVSVQLVFGSNMCQLKHMAHCHIWCNLPPNDP